MSNFKSVAIVGGTGCLGQRLTREFLNSGKFEVKVLTRPESKATEMLEEFRKMGAQIVKVDYSDHHNLKAALQTTQVLISALGFYDLYENQARFVSAAKEAGVVRFIPSEFGINVEGKNSEFFLPKVKTREMVKASGLEYTFYCTGFFMDHLLSPMMGIDLANAKATIVGRGETKLSVTAMVDVAKFVVNTINHPNSKNSSLYISGEDTTLMDAINDVGLVKDVKFKVEHIPLEVIRGNFAQKRGMDKFLDFLRMEIEMGSILNERNDVALAEGLTPMNISKFAKTCL
ncbi:hypothetical protein L0F63_005325 [Massospora cicadina]|nr:hypothetical protein L0F63_005325 [Massospora cicadina]